MTGMLGMHSCLTTLFFSFFVAEVIGLFSEYISREGSYMGNKFCEKLTLMNIVESSGKSVLEVSRIYRKTC